MKPKDRKEYLSMLDATIQSWLPYSNTVGLPPAEKAVADNVLAALRSRMEYVQTIKSSSRSSAKKTEPEHTQAQDSGAQDSGAQSEVPAAQNDLTAGSTSMAMKHAIGMLTDVAHFLDEQTCAMDDNLMAAAMDVQSARIRLLRAYNSK